MALSVKAYLLILPEQQEIRRFSIDDGASSNYEYLLTKIKTVFPGIRNKPLRLFWKDEDGELVTFSSDEELIEALGSIQGEVFRVYVKVFEGADNNEKQDGESTASQPQHVGVICDGCDHGIVGIRFKCVACPDYDLCMKCERKGLHNEHEMLRICTPRMHSAFSVFYPPFAHHVPKYPPPPHHPPGCGPPPHHPPGFGPWGRGRGSFRGGPFGRGRCGGPRGRCGKAPDANCNNHTETAPGSQEVPVGPPFLHAMGEAIANFLGPMGVEVHTYADSEKDCCNGKCNCDHNDQGSAAASTSAEGNKNESPKEGSTEQDNHSTASTTTEKSDQQTSTEDYVMVDQEKQSKEEAALNETCSKPEDLLEVTIAQMRAMGFEDHDGWLAQLIVSKEYDIGKVLDAMQYSQQ